MENLTTSWESSCGEAARNESGEGRIGRIWLFPVVERDLPFRSRKQASVSQIDLLTVKQFPHQRLMKGDGRTPGWRSQGELYAMQCDADADDNASLHVNILFGNVLSELTQDPLLPSLSFCLFFSHIIPIFTCFVVRPYTLCLSKMWPPISSRPTIKTAMFPTPTMQLL